MIENDNGYLTNIFFKHQFGNVLVGGTNGNLTTSVLKMSKYFWDIGSPELPRALEKSACLEGSDGTLYLLGGDDFFGTASKNIEIVLDLVNLLSVSNSRFICRKI